MAKLRREPRFRLECGHLSYAVIKLILNAFPGSSAWCDQCKAWRNAKPEGTPLW